MKAKANGYSNNIIYRQCIPADGRWNWVVEQSVDNPWGSGKLPVFKKMDENVTGGYHDLQQIPFGFENLKSPAVIHFMELEGKPEISIPHKGDGHDAFRIGGNTIFSDVTNPNNQLSDHSTTNFGFRINSQTGTKINITVFINHLERIGE